MGEGGGEVAELTAITAAKALSDEAYAWELMEAVRWPNGPICPHCGNMKAYFLAPQDGPRLTRKDA